jgi:hypothetical protein
MGNTLASQPAETLGQLVLRARHEVLVKTSDDWRVLASAAARMLFWYGGAIFGCRCEGREIRFALQVVHASLGAIAHQITSAYATHLRKTRALNGPLFKHYLAIRLDGDVFLEELVLWMHRPPDRTETSRGDLGSEFPLWTAESAYLLPNSLPWINADRVLQSMSTGAPVPATYRRRKLEAISPEVIEMFARRTKRGSEQQWVHPEKRIRPTIEAMARSAAEYCNVPYEDLLTDTRKRSVSRARAIAAVLATRNGSTAAEAARLFNRSRSSLIEQVEHYRAIQTEIFIEAEARLEARLMEVRE